MVEYVRGSDLDKWHWCKNCTQYPIYIYQKISARPPNLCEQCNAKEKNEDCECEETEGTAPEKTPTRLFGDFCYS